VNTKYETEIFEFFLPCFDTLYGYTLESVFTMIYDFLYRRYSLHLQ
jgi:hypothetical protein